MTKEDAEWLKEYCLSAADYADANTCVGQSEHRAADADRERASRLLDEVTALAAKVRGSETTLGSESGVTTVRELIAAFVRLGEEESDRRVLIEGSKYHDTISVHVTEGFVLIETEP